LNDITTDTNAIAIYIAGLECSKAEYPECMCVCMFVCMVSLMCTTHMVVSSDDSEQWFLHFWSYGPAPSTSILSYARH